MPNIKDTIKAKWGYFVGAIAAIAALVAALTPTTKDEDLGNAYSPAFKAAWERGAADSPSPTTPVSPTE